MGNRRNEINNFDCRGEPSPGAESGIYQGTMPKAVRDSVVATDDIYSVLCPTCGAGFRNYCVTKNGWTTKSTPCAARIVLAVETRRRLE